MRQTKILFEDDSVYVDGDYIKASAELTKQGFMITSWYQDPTRPWGTVWEYARDIPDFAPHPTGEAY